MKYIVLIPDGAADQPRPELDGRTPLQAAAIPNLDALAMEGEMGLARTVPEGFPPGSDVANLCVMGYDPHIYYTGRAPLEAASLGIHLAKSDVAFRCNLVWVEEGLMRDFSAGHISDTEAGELIDFLQDNLGGSGTEFHAGLSYRHIMVSGGQGREARCTPPHDITGRPIEGFLPTGSGSAWLRGLMDVSARILPDHPVNIQRQQEGKAPANMIWLWGQGTAPKIPTMGGRYGISGSVISAVDLVKGLGIYAGLEVIDVPGATGFLDTDYAAKAASALTALREKDFVYIHVEAPDEASHMGDSDAKVEAIERIDSELLAPLLAGLEDTGPFRLLVLPDHATPLGIKTHTDDPVPFLLYDSGRKGEGGGAFNEQDAARGKGGRVDGWKLMDKLLSEGTGAEDAVSS